jgi:hypothetical protein
VFARTVGLTLGEQLVASLPVLGLLSPVAALAVAVGAVLLTALGKRTFVPVWVCSAPGDRRAEGSGSSHTFVVPV